MGDRYFLHLHCAYCGHPNNDVYYAPTCDFEHFTCKQCGLKNHISRYFEAEKMDSYNEAEDLENESAQNA